MAFLDEIPSYGTLMTMDTFRDACKRRCLIDYDGEGEFATATHISGKVVYPSEIETHPERDKWSHVVWFNK